MQFISFHKKIVLPLALSLILILIVGFASPVMAVSVGGYVNGGGAISTSEGKDVFGGNAMTLKIGGVSGTWSHVTASGDHVIGKVEHIVLANFGPGPSPDPPSALANVAMFDGSATLNGESGYRFNVIATDYGEPGTSDNYHFILRKVSDSSVVYDSWGTLSSGDIQIHSPNNGHPWLHT